MQVFWDAEGGAPAGAGQTMELVAVHHLSDGDPATILTCHHIPGHLLAHRKDTERLGLGEAFDAGGRQNYERVGTAEHRAQTYHSLVLRGKLRTAVRWITKRDTGRVLQPGDRCTKTGDRVMEVL